MLAKPLNWVDLPETILTRNRHGVSMDGETASSKRTQSMNTSRKEARNFPRVNRPRNQVEELEGEIATYVEASIALTVKVRSEVPPGYVAVACIKRSILVPSLRQDRHVVTGPTWEARVHPATEPALNQKKRQAYGCGSQIRS